MNKPDSRNATMLDIVTDNIDSNNGSDSGVQAVEQEEERAKNNQDVRAPAATKPIIYIPPRLDQEYYQAEVAASSSIIAPSLDSVRGTNKILFCQLCNSSTSILSAVESNLCRFKHELVHRNKLRQYRGDKQREINKR
jgi:hypothetical protein